MQFETAFTMSTAQIKFGPGTTRELGYDLKRYGCKRVMVVTDPYLAHLPPVQIALDSLREVQLEYALFDDVEIEPTDQSFKRAIAFAMDGNFDGYVAVGGGSVIDTAKVAN